MNFGCSMIEMVRKIVSGEKIVKIMDKIEHNPVLSTWRKGDLNPKETNFLIDILRYV